VVLGTEVERIPIVGAPGPPARTVLDELTVLTPSLPDRASVLARLQGEIAAQTVLPAAHLVAIEEPSWDRGYDVHVRALVRIRNLLLYSCPTEWALTADDDDRWELDHVEHAWATHLAHPEAQIVYPVATARPETRPNATNPLSAMTSQALLHVPSIQGVGGWLYRPGMNEDVLADIYWVTQCNLTRVYCEHPTYRWDRGEHLHGVDVYGRDEQAALARQWNAPVPEV
jgi:hypothetical protein